MCNRFSYHVEKMFTLDLLTQYSCRFACLLQLSVMRLVLVTSVAGG